MRASSKTGLALAAAALGLAASFGIADARKSWNPTDYCYDPVEGLARETGILGMGTAKARIAARADWEAQASTKHGPAYASLDLARNVRWDCKKNAIILAKCVVIANPCSARLRG